MPNRLAQQTSPYLLQHAHNPVDWYPWGAEAFAEAQRSDRPIFLSIGYSTCYWCHVMERQCFEDAEIAALMNQHFVNIKVDREERPDIDDLYMTAVQLLTGRGGWPMSVFIAPPPGPNSGERTARRDDEAADQGARLRQRQASAGNPGAVSGLRPFYAGTYFPPQPTGGMPGFPQVLAAVAEAWRQRRPQVLEQADQVARAVTEHLARRDPPGPVGPALVQQAANQLAQQYDPEDGGFGGAPKFPQASNLLLLIAVHRNNPNPDLWHAVAHTLDRMARGGIYDQVGGGFHRYATDGKWLVPHFEKMLYDQGQLVSVYLEAHQVCPHDGDAGLYQRIVRQACDYVLREMTDASGAFWSAQDAEVDGREGVNYLWQPAEVDEAVGDANLAAAARRLYGLNGGANFQDPHAEDAPAAYVLHQPVPLHEFARGRGITVEQAAALKADIDVPLLASRSKRKGPRIDDKVIASWNGLMVAALADAGRVLREDRYTQAAARAAEAILAHMRDPRDLGIAALLLKHDARRPARVPAFLDDYAAMVRALVALHRATSEARWLAEAQSLATTAGTLFGRGDDGGYFDTLANCTDLFVRPASVHDGAVPSGASQMVHALLDLHAVTGERRWLDQSVRDLRAAAGPLARLGAGMVHMQHALLRALEIEATPLVTPSAGPAGITEAESPAVARPPSDGAADRIVSALVEPPEVDLSSGDAQATLVLTIAPPYHLQTPAPAARWRSGASGVTLATPGPSGPDARTAAEGIDLTADWPAGEPVPGQPAGENARCYRGEVRVPLHIRGRGRSTGTSPPRQVDLVLSYQPCDESACLAPRSLRLTLAVR